MISVKHNTIYDDYAMQTGTICSGTKTMTNGLSAYYRARLQAQPSKSLTRYPRYVLWSVKENGYLISDSHLVTSTSSWWTTNPDTAQVYYDQETAFGKAGILAGLTKLDIEVQCLD